MRRKIYAVIVNFNSGSELAKVLQDLKREGVKTIVVDNDSQDNSLILAYNFMDEFIQNKDNILFAKAANMGIKRAMTLGASHILILNFDVMIPEGTIKRFLKANTDIAGPKIYYDNVWSDGGKLDLKRGKLCHI